MDVKARLCELGCHRTPTDDGLDVPSRPPAPKVFVVSWLDYCTKYGMGFAMSDGTIAVHFNDTSSLVLSPGKMWVTKRSHAPCS